MSIIISGSNPQEMKNTVCLLFWLLLSAGCIQKFQPMLSSTPTGYLVVEGIINGSGASASVTLSRTTTLSDTSIVFESGAMVQVEGNDNTVYVFKAQGNGIYSIADLSLSSVSQYRLRIKTADGDEYLSDFSAMITTPPIDSISWQLTGGGLQVYANTHDPQNSVQHYKWDFLETWEYHSPYVKQLVYDTTYLPGNGAPILNVGQTPTDTTVYTCWQSAQSTEILLASTTALSSDFIYDFPLTLIPQSSVKLTTDYSILVRQYGLTEDAFNFLQIMKSNTQETGSIFSPQPSQLQGNVHSLMHPAETVVGYVGFCSVQSQRVFIHSSQLPLLWSSYVPPCTEDSIYVLDPTNRYYPQDQISGAIIEGLVPTTLINLNRFLAAPASCVDCTLTGTNQKPTYWQ
jgi:hypothetical protein